MRATSAMLCRGNRNDLFGSCIGCSDGGEGQERERVSERDACHLSD